MDLLIVGASARSAAFSAHRIGLKPTCIDLFADADLAATGRVVQVSPGLYPEGLERLAADLRPMPWLYTGAIENHPDLVDLISKRHHLLGNPGETLRAVRDPLALSQIIRDAGLDAPRIQLDPEGLPVDGSWLRKPLASSGGRGIQPWIGQRANTQRQAYFQERVAGLSLSAIFVGDGSKARCQGVSRQYVGKKGNRFAYRGSLAPWPISDEVRDRVDRLGKAIGSRFGLLGLFGIDLILKDGQPWPVEVNPRYTASVEVLEWALGRSLLAEHLSTCGLGSDENRDWSRPERFAAKALVHADRAFRWPDDESNLVHDPTEFPEIADIPRPGTTFRSGDPILSVFAQGDSPEQCRRKLTGMLLTWRRRFRFGSTS